MLTALDGWYPGMKDARGIGLLVPGMQDAHSTEQLVPGMQDAHGAG